MTDTPAAPAAPAPAAPPAPALPWYDGADAEVIGHIQNRGWDKLDPKAAALNAVKSHREAEKLIGAPANELLRMPKDANDAEGWGRVRERLGVPADAKGYDFSTVKFADGSALDQGVIDVLGPALHGANVSKDKANEVVQAVVKYLDNADATDTKNEQDKLNIERDALKVNWGSNVEANLLVAKNAAAALNVKPEAVAALEKVIGYAAVMEMFRNIGSRIGEDTFITNHAPGGSGVISADQATATLAEKQNDAAWVAKLNAGDAMAMKEFNSLTTVIAAARRSR